ncbi:hypothetical protein HQ531_11860 [bacterium]|nr:hypothetical protein [bacterium]
MTNSPEYHSLDSTAILQIIVSKLSHSTQVLLSLIFISGTALGMDQDSLAYIYHQDNLSTNNDLQLNYEFDFDRSSLLINDALRYKVFAFEHSVSQAEQYSIEHRLQSDWNWGVDRNKSIRFENSSYQDHRTGLASAINNRALLVGIKRSNFLSLFLGGRSVERYGIMDEGWTTELELHKTWLFDPQRLAFNISAARDELKEHVNHQIEAQSEYFIRFSRISSYHMALQREVRMQAFFTDSLGSTQSRYNENLQWRNRFVYKIGKNLELYHQLVWEDQLTEIAQEKVGVTETIRIPSVDRERFSLVNETGVEVKRPAYSALTSFKVENSQNKYYVDYTQVLYQLREEMNWQTHGVIDSLMWKTVLSRLEYDTPDTTNDDDRDEWRFNTEFRVAWQPSPFYHLELGTKLSLFHLIYLFNSRSSENHWNRNLVLWSGFSWRKRSWEGHGRARIRSNYFDYDYDDLFLESDQPIRSFVHRSLDIQDQTTYHFNRHWSISGKVAARWEDQGQLNWGAFIQQVNSDRDQIELIIKLYYDYRGWKGWIGFLSHERRTNYSETSRDSELWSGTGPLFGIRHRLGSRLFLDADARIISVQDQDREYILPKVFFTLVYR